MNVELLVNVATLILATAMFAKVWRFMNRAEKFDQDRSNETLRLQETIARIREIAVEANPEQLADIKNVVELIQALADQVPRARGKLVLAGRSWGPPPPQHKPGA